HGLMRERLRVRTVEIGPVEAESGGIRHRLAAEQPDEGEQQFGAEAVAVVENTQAHQPAASVSAARPLLYIRLDSPTAAQMTSSNSWSSVKPAASAAAKSASV